MCAGKDYNECNNKQLKYSDNESKTKFYVGTAIRSYDCSILCMQC